MSEVEIPEQSGSGPRHDGKWCVSCGVWATDENGREECPVSRERMTRVFARLPGLSHLWAQGVFTRGMVIWEQDADIRARLAAR